MDSRNHSRGIRSLSKTSLFDKELSPTLVRLLFRVLKDVWRDVITWLKLSNENSIGLKSMLYNLKRQSANLYFNIWSGVALLHKLWIFSNDTLKSFVLQHTLSALAEALSIKLLKLFVSCTSPGELTCNK